MPGGIAMIYKHKERKRSGTILLNEPVDYWHGE